MQYISDLEIHSKYARAVSPDMTSINLAIWGKKKGIDIIGTGDFTHPFWFSELRNNLEEDSNHAGFFRLKKGLSPIVDEKGSPLFALTAETSHIFSLNGKVKRIHLLIYAPSFEVAEKLNRELSKRGNLLSDGRPILGLSGHDLLAIALSIHQDLLIIPAHVWTPWFGLYGANGGVDTMSEVFLELSPHIFAVETGLSSDPAMNWRITELENRRIISFSDAHSLPKLGREATVFEKNGDTFSYSDFAQVIKGQGEAKIAFTIEFHPEEGKYHYTGHRNCNVVQDPAQTKSQGTKCPVCGRTLTVGVLHRNELLGGQEIKSQKSKIKINDYDLEMETDPTGKHPPYVMTVPLQEILAETIGAAVNTLKVQNEYEKLVSHFGSEFNVLLKAKLKEIENTTDDRVAEAIRRVRFSQLTVDPGYDGVFGVVKIWGEQGKVAKAKEVDQQSLF